MNRRAWAISGFVGALCAVALAGSSYPPQGSVGVSSASLDSIFGSTQGDLLYRNATTWAVLPTGTSGQILSSGGAGGNPSWAADTGGEDLEATLLLGSAAGDLPITGLDTLTGTTAITVTAVSNSGSGFTAAFNGGHNTGAGTGGTAIVSGGQADSGFGGDGTVRGGEGSTYGGTASLLGGAGGTNGGPALVQGGSSDVGGNVSVLGGPGTTTGGNTVVRGGNGGVTHGTVTIGNSNTSAVNIGAASITTTMSGTVAFTGTVTGISTPSAWASFTPTGSWSTNTTYTGHYRIVANVAEVRVQVTCSGAPDTATFTLDAPSGYSWDASLMESGNFQAIGTATILDSGTDTYHAVTLFDQTSDVVHVNVPSVTGTLLTVNNKHVTQAFPITWANGDRIQIHLFMPVTTP